MKQFCNADKLLIPNESSHFGIKQTCAHRDVRENITSFNTVDGGNEFIYEYGCLSFITLHITVCIVHCECHTISVYLYNLKIVLFLHSQSHFLLSIIFFEILNQSVSSRRYKFVLHTSLCSCKMLKSLR